MKQTLTVKLAPTAEQAQRLLDTMEAFNAACNFIAEVAFRLKTANKYRLQHETYATVREQFGLSSQMAIRAISKVSEAYKRDKSIQPSFRPHGAMCYDERILSWKRADRVSLLALKGRIVVPYRFGAYQAARLDRKRGQADLIYRGGTFYLYVTTEAPEADPITPEGVLGIDLGIVELATDSEGHSYSGEPVKAVRRRMKRIRSLLQSKGTKSARRHLKKIRRRQSRFVRSLDACKRLCYNVLGVSPAHLFVRSGQDVIRTVLEATRVSLAARPIRYDTNVGTEGPIPWTIRRRHTLPGMEVTTF